MMASVDGRIDCDMTELLGADYYYEALAELQCSAWLEGRASMQKHHATAEPFVCEDKTPAGQPCNHIAVVGDRYCIAVDTHGKLRWPENTIDGAPMVVLTCEDVPQVYLDVLTSQGISWICVGKNGQLDLAAAMQVLHDEFGVQRLSVVGGGRINGGFLNAGLIDEVSVMYGAGIDGRDGQPTVFDGCDANRLVVKLAFKNVKVYKDGTVWIRYDVVNND